MLRKTIRYIIILLGIFLGFLVTKTFLLKSKQLDVAPTKQITVADSAINRLSNAIRYATVSHWDASENDIEQFDAFHHFLRSSFPLIFEKAEVQKFNNHALYITLKGRRSDLKPIILLAHQDVVPVVAKNWSKPPFGGVVDNEFVWGRGTLDDKGSLMAIMEAVELFLKEKIEIERTIILAFGDDEEVRGKGAQAMAAHLKASGIEPEFVLDEGMVITKGLVPMVDKPVALIGTSEKGYVSIRLSCDVAGGHSSTPAKETAISNIAKAVTDLTQHRFKACFSKPVDQFLDYLGPEIKWPTKVVFANRWMFSPVILNIYQKSHSGNALVRTTTAPTILKGGIKDNVIPTMAEAVINFRLLPGQTVKGLLKHVEETIENGNVKIEVYKKQREAAPISPIETAGFMQINKTIRQEYEDTYVMPTLMIAASDSRYYSGVCENIYRFAPYQLDRNDLGRIHSTDERIAIKDYQRMISFYFKLINNCNQEI